VGGVNCCAPVHLIIRNVNSSSFPAASEENGYVNMNVIKRIRLDCDGCCDVDKPGLTVYYTSISARIADKKMATL
jgi:hypothetical protein